VQGVYVCNELCYDIAYTEDMSNGGMARDSEGIVSAEETTSFHADIEHKPKKNKKKDKKGDTSRTEKGEKKGKKDKKGKKSERYRK
jgi:hypothetical protein